MFWVVEQRNLWGDYGTILISGSAHREASDGPLLLHRAGPFLPPISFPWLRAGGHRIVVSDEFRHELEREGFPGLRFRPATKARIIKLAWHEWDRAAEEPKRYPLGGEPEGYIWDKPHDPRTAARMPEAWEFLPQFVPLRVEQLEDPDGGFIDKYRVYPDRAVYPGLFINRENDGKLIVDDEVRRWFEERVGEWVRFCKVEVISNGLMRGLENPGPEEEVHRVGV